MAFNYRAWDVNIEDFSEQKSEEDKLRFLLRFAVLAPSGHNTQPWDFSIKGNEMSLWVNQERSLEGSDPDRHQLLIAFGCMIENLCIAAQYYGFEPKIVYSQDLYKSDLIARILLDVRGSNQDSFEGLLSAIMRRRTNRGKYSNQILPASFTNQIKGYGDEDLKILLINDNSKRNDIADIVVDAQIEAMESPAFREELSHYIKSSFTKEHVGMPGFALEIPAPVSLFASRLIKRINLSKQTKKKDSALLKMHTPTFMIISTAKDDPEDRLKAGRVFERIWLTATAGGLSCSPFAGAIQSGQHATQLKKVLDIDFVPQVFSRIGFAKKGVRHSPRFSADQLIADNGKIITNAVRQ